MISAPPRRSATPVPPSALELDLPPSSLIALLGRLTAPAIVVRCGGISLFRRGPLHRGISVSLTNPPSEPSFADSLTLDPGSIRRICLLRDHGGTSSLEVEFARCGFALSVWCGEDRRDAGILHHLAATTPVRPLLVETVNRAGAAAWLDDFPTDSPSPFCSRFLFDRDKHEVSIFLRSPDLAVSTSFIPSFVDRDGETLRLANAGGDRVIHLRAGTTSSPFPPTIEPHHARP